jgi:septum formation protein
VSGRSFPDIVLASASTTRLRILEAAGITVLVEPSQVDERPVKVKLAATRVRAESVATTLAELKSVSVSRIRIDALVIGADQVLEFEGRIYDKPGTRDAAKRQLRELRGRKHRLITAASLASAGEIVWRHLETASLTMRVFSDSFLDAYLDRAGDEVLGSVGAYHIEGLGAQLFSKVEGDHYVIRGLPLWPLLDQLRQAGAIAS